MNDTPDLHEQVAAYEAEGAVWRRFGYAGAFIVVLAVAIGLGLVVRGSLSQRITKVERAEDPCSVALHGRTCQIRTCERLVDIAENPRAVIRLFPSCANRLEEVRRGASEGPGGTDRKGVVGDNGNSNPSGKPGGHVAPSPKPTTPQNPGNGNPITTIPVPGVPPTVVDQCADDPTLDCVAQALGQNLDQITQQTMTQLQNLLNQLGQGLQQQP